MNDRDETGQEEERRFEREAQLLFEQLTEAHELLGPLSAARYEVVDKLERVDESKLGPLLDSKCGICYDSFAAIIANEEQMLAMEYPISERELGVTKLQSCGHYFCRKDISKWILEGNDLCPYCRTPYLPASTLTVSAGDAANTDRRMDTSLEAMMEHLQSRWDAGHASETAGQQRLPTGSGMYS